MNQTTTEPTMAQFDPAVSEAFDVLQTPDLPSIQEDRFVREFLPMFANLDGSQVNLNSWLDIAGHPHMPVNVLRGNTFLFRVPPILRDVRMIPGEQSKGQSLYEEILTAEKKRAILPALGEAHMRDNIISRVKHDAASLEYIVAWNSIFKVYGYPEVELPKPIQDALTEAAPEAEATPAAADNPNDVISDFREL